MPGGAARPPHLAADSGGSMRKLALLLCVLLCFPFLSAMREETECRDIVVAADLHYISPSLTDGGAAFTEKRGRVRIGFAKSERLLVEANGLVHVADGDGNVSDPLYHCFVLLVCPKSRSFVKGRRDLTTRGHDAEGVIRAAVQHPLQDFEHMQAEFFRSAEPGIPRWSAYGASGGRPRASHRNGGSRFRSVRARCGSVLSFSPAAAAGGLSLRA